jgi:tRNA dimethylallyltransferase
MARAIREASSATVHIINADVSQMYPGLPIATNKPQGEGDLGGIPHHLIAQLKSDEEYSVHRFTTDAFAIMREVEAREPQPCFIIVGGTHYYVQGLLFGGGELAGDAAAGGASENAGLAASLLRADETLHDALLRVDPVMGRRWHPNDTQRLERCLAFFARTGQLPSDHEPAPGASPHFRTQVIRGGQPPLVVAVDCDDRDVLEAAHRARVGKMVSKGLLQEVAAYARGSRSPFLERTIGFQEFAELVTDPAEEACLARGELTDRGRAALDELVRNTRRYALQQQQWIRNRFLGKYRAVLRPCYVRITSGANAAAVSATLARLCVTDRADVLAVPLPAGASAVSAAPDDAAQTATPVADLAVRRCDPCHMSLCGEAQWNAHVNSRKHRNVLRRHEERRNRPPHHGGTARGDERPTPSQPRPIAPVASDSALGTPP